MKKTAKKPQFVKTINFILVLAIFGALMLEAWFLTQAQAGDENKDSRAIAAEPFKQDIGSICDQRIKNFMAGKKREFGKFMNNHFQSAKPTSQLISAAIERYAMYREEVRLKMQEFSPEGGKLAKVAASERPACEKAVEEDFILMKQLIKQHIVQNAYAKKSTRLLDKYKLINEKLGKLNFTIAQTYGYFAALSQKLPCYAQQCVGK